MKYKIIYFLVLITYNYCHGQDQEEPKEDTTFTVDLLRAPNSPAANLLNFSTSQIEKPTDPAGFVVLAQQKSNNFSSLPTDFAVDMAPFILFAGNKMTFKNFESNKLPDNFKQSFTFSLATQTLDSLDGEVLSSNLRQVAIGTKFSLLRGTLNKSYYATLNNIRNERKKLLKMISHSLDSLLNNDKFYKVLTAQFDSIRKDTALSSEVKKVLFQDLNKQRQQREEALIEELQFKNSEEYQRIKQSVEEFSFTRIGWKLDLSGGIVLNYPDGNFKNGALSKAGIWILGGYESSDGVSFLGIARYLYNPDKLFSDNSDILMSDNINTLDLGLRVIYSGITNKFGISGEIVSRSAYGNSEVDDALRWTINATYDVGKNKQLQFAYGKNFDNSITKKADLIAALSFLIGFGTEKTL